MNRTIRARTRANDRHRRGQSSALGAYLVVVNLLLLYVLLKMLPAAAPAGMGDRMAIARDGFVNRPPREVRLLIIAAASGALGTYAITATSFAVQVGKRVALGPWITWYLSRPLMGMARGVLAYLAIGAGVFAAGRSAEGLSAYFVAAVAGIAGMCSRRSMERFGRSAVRCLRRMIGLR